MLLSATVPPASGVCGAAGVWISLSGAVMLISGDCRDDNAGAAQSAEDGTCASAVAGAWTATGWPATMEGAVRSGLAAARHALEANPASRPVEVTA